MDVVKMNRGFRVSYLVSHKHGDREGFERGTICAMMPDLCPASYVRCCLSKQ